MKKQSRKSNTKGIQLFFNWHMHKIGPRKRKYNIFGDQFYSENCQKAQIRYAPLFLCKKTYDMINLPEVNEFTRNCKFCFNLVRVPVDP